MRSSIETTGRGDETAERGGEAEAWTETPSWFSVTLSFTHAVHSSGPHTSAC